MKLILQFIQWAIDMKLMLQWAVTSGILILIVLAVRRLFREKLSARLRYALWGVVLLRLLVPFQIELPADTSAALPVLASNLAQDVTPWLDDTMLYALPAQDQPSGNVPAGLPPQYVRNGAPGPNWEYYSGGQVYDGERITHYAFMMTAFEVLVLIWGAGTVLAALVILISNLRFARRLRKRRKKLEVPDAPIPVYVAEGLPSPCLFGVLWPAVYLNPSAEDDSSALRHVLAHELTHYAHKDHLWSLLRCLALALHWYNPLVWAAVVLSKGDGELACDEGAVARLGEEERIPYGRTLVDMVAARSLRPADLLSCSTAMTGGKKSIQQRVALLVKHPETVKTAVFAAAAILALGLVFVFAVRAEPKANTMFQDQLDLASGIRYAPPLHSSQIYPDPITDEDLLAQAKEQLSAFTPVDAGSIQLHQSGLISLEHISLVDSEGAETVYTLFAQGDTTYLFSGDIWQKYLDMPDENGGRPESINAGPALWAQSGGIGAALENLARQQYYREREDLSPATYQYNQYLNQLDAAQGIWLSAPMLHDGRVLTDPEQLEQVKNLLVLTPIPQDVPLEWTGYWDQVIAFTATPPDADWAGDSGSYYYVKYGEDGLCYVLLPTNNASGFASGNYLGTISKENWERAEEILWNAPSVDDRQHAARDALLGDLTQEQVDRANEAFAEFVEVSPGGYASSEISCFFTSNYEDPTQIDLEEFLRYCPIGTGDCLGEEDTEEFLAVMAQDNSWVDPERELHSPYDLPVPVHRYPRAEVSALLQKYAGVAVEELDWEGCLYVEEYDAFYNFTSDAGPGFFPCAGGQIMEDSVLLWSRPNEDGDRCELVLRKNGDGWLIQSHHTIYER